VWDAGIAAHLVALVLAFGRQISSGRWIVDGIEQMMAYSGR